VGSARGRLFNFDFPFNFGHFGSLSDPHFCSCPDSIGAGNHRPDKDDQDGEILDGSYYSR